MVQDVDLAGWLIMATEQRIEIHVGYVSSHVKQRTRAICLSATLNIVEGEQILYNYGITLGQMVNST